MKGEGDNKRKAGFHEASLWHRERLFRRAETPSLLVWGEGTRAGQGRRTPGAARTPEHDSLYP